MKEIDLGVARACGLAAKGVASRKQKRARFAVGLCVYLAPRPGVESGTCELKFSAGGDLDLLVHLVGVAGIGRHRSAN